MHKLRLIIIWITPFLIYSSEACAWGLYTHLYFTQLLIWGIPLADPRLRRAVKRFPQLVLAGACLPDLALFGKSFGTHAFTTTHQWKTARKLLNNAASAEEHALAIGFSSHLLVDVIAHNHFVPAHQEIWFDSATLTHATSEWAMDAYVSQHTIATPFTLLRKESKKLVQYIVKHFECTDTQARKSLITLAYGDGLLRFSRLPSTCYVAGLLADQNLRKRFDYYLSETNIHMRQIDRVLAGEEPRLHPEICEGTYIRSSPPLSQDLFQEL